MKPEEFQRIGKWVVHLMNKHAIFILCWLIWMIAAFFTVGPITDLWLVDGDDWLLWTFGVMLLPGPLAIPNAIVVHFRTTHERKLSKLERMQQRTAELEKELELYG